MQDAAEPPVKRIKPLVVTVQDLVDALRFPVNPQRAQKILTDPKNQGLAFQHVPASPFGGVDLSLPAMLIDEHGAINLEKLTTDKERQDIHKAVVYVLSLFPAAALEAPAMIIKGNPDSPTMSLFEYWRNRLSVPLLETFLRHRRDVDVVKALEPFPDMRWDDLYGALMLKAGYVPRFEQKTPIRFFRYPLLQLEELITLNTFLADQLEMGQGEEYLFDVCSVEPNSPWIRFAASDDPWLLDQLRKVQHGGLRYVSTLPANVQPRMVKIYMHGVSAMLNTPWERLIIPVLAEKIMPPGGHLSRVETAMGAMGQLDNLKQIYNDSAVRLEQSLKCLAAACHTSEVVRREMIKTF